MLADYLSEERGARDSTIEIPQFTLVGVAEWLKRPGMF